MKTTKHRPMKRSIALLLLASAVAAPAAAAAPPIQTGYWESTNRIVSPIKQTKTEKRCITPADVNKFMAGPSNRHYQCTYPTNVIAGGKITLKGTCVSKKGQKVPITGQGTYTPTSFNLVADVIVEFLGLDVAVRASTEARKIAETCPAPEPQAEAQPQGAK
jgi:hypothetical protein